MSKQSLTCDDLPQDLPDAEFLAAWRENFSRKFGALGSDVVARCDLPGKSRVTVMPLSSLSVMDLSGKFDQMTRNRASAPGEDQESLAIVVNRGAETVRFHKKEREIAVEPGQSALVADGMTGRFEATKRIDVAIFRLPHGSLASALRRPEDLATSTLPANCEPMRMLDAYARAMMATEGVTDASTSASIGSHMIDLVALALAAGREAQDLAQQGALQAGRLNMLLREIETGYLDSDFSIQKVAERQRVTPRYLQHLLAQTAASFAERVIEMRLQHARKLLERPDMAHRKVIDIAFSSGFNDLSYFTRRFRSRFAMTPGDARVLGSPGA